MRGSLKRHTCLWVTMNKIMESCSLDKVKTEVEKKERNLAEISVELFVKESREISAGDDPV